MSKCLIKVAVWLMIANDSAVLVPENAKETDNLKMEVVFTKKLRNLLV